LGKSIARLKATHNCAKASKFDSTEAGDLHAELYLVCGTEVMLLSSSSNLWADVSIHNDAKVKVVMRK